MAAKKKSKFENKFKSTAASESRTANVRDERKVKDEQPKLSFNFKDSISTNALQDRLLKNGKMRKCLINL